jgi:hypothetical protein
MAIPTVVNGNLVRWRFTFTQDGKLVDPPTVTVVVEKPGQAPATLTYGTDPQVTRRSKGTYRVELDADTDGDWTVRPKAPGSSMKSAAKAQFKVYT